LTDDALPTAGPDVCTRETRQGLTDFPIQLIAGEIQPDQNQQVQLQKLKTATQQAVEILRSACPTDLPSTPTGRMEAMRARVETMLLAIQFVLPALEKFYASLSDEQKHRFDALDAENLQTASAARQPAAIAHVCDGRGDRTIDLPIERIERRLHLSAAQEAALSELKDAIPKAADILRQNCPADQPVTPTGRLAAMKQRLSAIFHAVDTVQPALAKFYDSLSDEQKAQLKRGTGDEQKAQLKQGTGNATAAIEGDGWGRYRDHDLGMSFDFPAHIFPLRSAEQGRSDVVFSTGDGRARIRVFGFVNEEKDTPRRYLARIVRTEQGRFTYVRTTPRFFVASGTLDGMIFYRRCNFFRSADQRVSCLQLDYPQQEKRDWDRIVTRISASLAPAD
jgi:hypothetical protein